MYRNISGALQMRQWTLSALQARRGKQGPGNHFSENTKMGQMPVKLIEMGNDVNEDPCLNAETLRGHPGSKVRAFPPRRQGLNSASSRHAIVNDAFRKQYTETQDQIRTLGQSRGKTVEPSAVVPPSYCTRNQPLPVVDDLSRRIATKPRHSVHAPAQNLLENLPLHPRVDVGVSMRTRQKGKRRSPRHRGKGHVQHRAYRTDQGRRRRGQTCTMSV